MDNPAEVAKIAAGMALLLLAGCEDAQVISSRDDGLQASTRSCTHTSYCLTLMPGFDGNMKYEFKLSPHCPGTVEGVARVYTDTMRYPSKPDETFTQTRKIWVRDTGVCS